MSTLSPRGGMEAAVGRPRWSATPWAVKGDLSIIFTPRDLRAALSAKMDTATAAVRLARPRLDVPQGAWPREPEGRAYSRPWGWPTTPTGTEPRCASGHMATGPAWQAIDGLRPHRLSPDRAPALSGAAKGTPGCILGTHALGDRRTGTCPMCGTGPLGLTVRVPPPFSLGLLPTWGSGRPPL